MRKTYLAVDFGGGSGRVMAGFLHQGKLELKEIYRFGNRQIQLGDQLCWDFPALFQDMKDGLRLAAQTGYDVQGIGIDTWGVDFGLIDRQGKLIGLPVCYRDSRTDGMPERFFANVDASVHYACTGTQVMSINTLFQLYSMQQNQDPQWDIAEKLLFMPDLFSYFLTGVANNEYSIASTSELLDASTRTWSEETMKAAGIPVRLFGEIVMPGTIRGKLKKEIAAETGLGEVEVIAVGSHDTASAASVVSDQGGTTAFLSSGTWSLLGIELPEPILTEEARRASFTNEGGVGGRITFLQNITGLWILQRLMTEWKDRGEEQHYDTLIPQTVNVAIDALIPVDDAAFMNPENMEEAIQMYCREHGQTVPQTKGETVRCVLQSLAERYKQAIKQLNTLLSHPITQLNIIGGGCQNQLLNQLTADALGIPVVAGPVEATAIGNILAQAIAKGDIIDLHEAKSIVANSFLYKSTNLINKRI